MKCVYSIAGTIIIAGLLLSGCAEKKDAKTETQKLTILWAKWKPADYLQKLTEDFTKQTGIQIEIIQDSWATWQKLFISEMAKKENCKFDMVIGDSQWLGIGATKGYYIELTKWMQDNNVKETMTESAITGYSEYPKQSGHYWAIPLEGDAVGFAYRKDLFENQIEKQNFQKKYGYRLDVPQNWQQLKDIAEFFYRPKKDFYGVLVWCEPDYDGITMAIETLIWAWGADLGDAKSYKVNGILNTQDSIDAINFYKQLNKYNNPDWVKYYLDTNASSNKAMMEGKVAMAMVYFSISQELLNKKNTPYADKIGFFACPKGPKAKAAALGGQGISVISYSKKKDAVFEFLEWLIKKDTQKKWASAGGLTCNKAILYSQDFINMSPMHKAFVESIEMVKDFWAVPEYTKLLEVSQKYFYQAVVEKNISAETAVNNIAKQWEQIFEFSGYYKE